MCLTVDAFLDARAAEIAETGDEERAVFLEDLASEYREVDSVMVAYITHSEALRFSDHPDWREEWRVEA